MGILNIKKAAVLGAGVMGAQIAAHLTNIGVKTILFDLPAKSGDANALVKQSLKALTKLKPDPSVNSTILQNITPANFDDDLDKLRDCDFILEAISERMDYKLSLYEKIVPYINDSAVFATNTSGLSVNKLAEKLPSNLVNRFLGVHFFNPPRYMKLVELIPQQATDAKLIDDLETFLVSRMGKGVVHAFDTPNFVGNRIGVFAFLASVYHAEKLNLSPDIVDALSGTRIGRPKSATFRTMDVVGLDTMAHVVRNLQENLTDDPWVKFFKLPDWITALIDKGALGQKTRAGVYKKQKGEILVIDKSEGRYRPQASQLSEEALLSFNEPVAKRFELWRKSSNPQLQFLWRCYRDLFHYCAFHLQSVAKSVREVDQAIKWGFGWEKGPFEDWDEAGWHEVAKQIKDEISKGDTMATADLPGWVTKATFKGPYKQQQAFAPKQDTYLEASKLPVYKRQLFANEPTRALTAGDTIFETDTLRFWTLDKQVAIASFKTKKNTISLDLLESLQESIAKAEQDYKALVIWQSQGNDFSFGADLKRVLTAIGDKDFAIVDKAVAEFQNTALKLRYAKIPTVAAVRGLTLGGSLELAMHTSKIVAASETYMGLVEIGVGLLPGGSGTKELALRAARQNCDNLIVPVAKAFNQIINATVSTSADYGRELGYLRATDEIIFNSDELLFKAQQAALNLADLNFHPPVAEKFPVVGKAGYANLVSTLINMREGEFISDFEFDLGSKIAKVICGDKLEFGSHVDEQWILRLEREAIAELFRTAKTQERMAHMLKMGKVLRN